MVARSEGPAHFNALNYIQQVSENIQLPIISAARYIEEQIADVFDKENN